MRVSNLFKVVVSALFAISSVLAQLGPTAPAGTHNDLNRWCGKAYEAGYVYFSPIKLI